MPPEQLPAWLFWLLWGRQSVTVLWSCFIYLYVINGSFWLCCFPWCGSRISLCMVPAMVLCIPQRNVIPVVFPGRALLVLLKILKYNEGVCLKQPRFVLECSQEGSLIPRIYLWGQRCSARDKMTGPNFRYNYKKIT